MPSCASPPAHERHRRERLQLRDARSSGSSSVARTRSGCSAAIESMLGSPRTPTSATDGVQRLGLDPVAVAGDVGDPDRHHPERHRVLDDVPLQRRPPGWPGRGERDLLAARVGEGDRTGGASSGRARPRGRRGRRLGGAARAQQHGQRPVRAPRAGAGSGTSSTFLSGSRDCGACGGGAGRSGGCARRRCAGRGPPRRGCRRPR